MLTVHLFYLYTYIIVKFEIIIAFLVNFIGVIDGYADEKTLFERQIQEKTDIKDRLEQELLCAGNRLQELEAEQQQIQEERELLSRQKEAMKAGAGPVEQRTYFSTLYETFLKSSG